MPQLTDMKEILLPQRKKATFSRRWLFNIFIRMPGMGWVSYPHQYLLIRLRTVFSVLLDKRKRFFDGGLYSGGIFSAGCGIKWLTAAAAFDFAPGFTYNLAGI